jgi:serine/threonine protein phosphatase PrpC
MLPDLLLNRSLAVLKSQLLCVFDGHGDFGHLVSSHLRQRVPELVFAASDDALDRAPGDVMQAAIQTAEAELIADPAVNTGLSGSTAVVCLVQNDRVTTANVVSLDSGLEQSRLAVCC